MGPFDLTVHHVTSLVVGAMDHFPRDDRDREFWRRTITVTREDGAVVQLTLFADTPEALSIESN